MPRNDEQQRPDPTRMVNQPALQTSKGLVWLIVGALFAVFSLVPFAALAFAQRASAGVAMVVVAVIVLLYVLMLVARATLQPRVRRLKIMAALFLTMAAVALIGGVLCVFIEYSTQ